jgi:hypothetical protein
MGMLLIKQFWPAFWAVVAPNREQSGGTIAKRKSVNCVIGPQRPVCLSFA